MSTQQLAAETAISERQLLIRLREIRRTLDPETYDMAGPNKKSRRAIVASEQVFELIADVESGRLSRT